MKSHAEQAGGPPKDYSLFSPKIFRRQTSAPVCAPQVYSDAFRELAISAPSPEHGYRVYDPFCGNGNGLAALALYQSPPIETIYGSDIDGEAVMAARRNLAMTSVHGINSHFDGLHQDFLQSLDRTGLRDLLKLQNHLIRQRLEAPVWHHIFKANALNDTAIREREIPEASLSMILTDPPYGQQCDFTGMEGEKRDSCPAELTRMAIEKCRSRLRDGALAGIILNGRSDQKKRIKKVAGILNEADGYRFLKAVMPQSFLETNRCLFVLEADSCD